MEENKLGQYCSFKCNFQINRTKRELVEMQPVSRSKMYINNLE